ncbi:MAG: PH domain-containing protein [Pseudomonadota bacterium]
MGYVDKTLASGEEIVFRARFNWTYDFAAYFWLLAGLTPLAFVTWLGYSMQSQTLADSVWLIVFCHVGVALGVILWLERMINKWTTEIVVTNQRFVFKTGLIARHASEVNLVMIEEVSFKESFWGRVFGYGVLVIRGAGVGVLELPPIDKPVQLRRAIQDAKGRRGSHASEEAVA